MKLALLGDIAFIGKYSSNDNPNIERKLDVIQRYLSSFDYVVGNLETPFSFYKKRYGAKSAFLCAEKESVKTLKYLHVNAVNLANNHIYDYGMEGLEFTRRLLEANGIDYFGVAGKSLRKTIDDNRLAFEGFCCYSSNPLRCVEYGQYGVNAYNIKVVGDVLERNKIEGFLNIVSVHAGLEHVNYPSIEHVRAARLLTDVCSYVYYGHHPHVIQGVESYHGSLIAHSLGNFCFDDVYTDASDKPLITLTENNRTGLILELTIEKNKIEEWKEQVIYIAKDGGMRLVDRNDELKDYNDALLNCENDEVSYNERRNNVLTARMTERKAMRNVSWYFKRLRPMYAKLILDGRRNAKLYRKNVKYYIEDEL